MEMGERPFHAASSGSQSQEYAASTSDSRGGLRVTHFPRRTSTSSACMAAPLLRDTLYYTGHERRLPAFSLEYPEANGGSGIERDRRGVLRGLRAKNPGRSLGRCPHRPG